MSSKVIRDYLKVVVVMPSANFTTIYIYIYIYLCIPVQLEKVLYALNVEQHSKCFMFGY